MSKTPRERAGREPKMGKVGMLTIQFEDCKDGALGYIVCDVDHLTYITTKKKASKTLKIDETLYFPINSARPNIHFFLYKPRLIGSKCVGFYQLNMADIKESDQELHYVQSIKKPKNILEPDIGEVRQPEETGTGNDKKKKKKEKVLPQFKVSMKFTPVPVEEKKLDGIVLEGEWKKGFDAGNIISNPKWYENPQFLLTLTGKLHIKVCLKQDNINNRVTFFIVKYDQVFYENRPLTLFDPNEVIKIDENFLNTMASDNIEHSFELDAGSYVIIPTNLNRISSINPEPYHGKFQIAVSTEHMEAIEFIPIDYNKEWKFFEDSKKWTQTSNGGADRGSPYEFYHNYQYVIETKKDTKMSITMEQPDNKNKIGFYLFETKQTDRKEIDFGELVEETTNLISNVCVGKNFKLREGKYILVPCTSEAGEVGEFKLKIYYEEENVIIKELTKEWSNIVSVNGEWKEGTAGGSVDDPESFVTNPQYVIKAKYNKEECKDIIILLSQFIGASGKIESIGLPVFVNLEQKLDADDINEDNLVNLPEAWVRNRNVFTCFEVDEEDGLEVIVIPSTMKPNTFANFKITILTDVKDVTIEALE
ncbi:calpain large subunit domain III containing protein [Entamoeba histolytica HM-1:IMSS-B]|uniref:Calpain large subunit domain III containing protein n=6 Tax=Entamoeba histolytica TaxID=5759 RepID=C4M9C0_ENTH1|nr:calpain large subunit domain III containing protein [Entamoeba histolytica HM-1:IMSS]EMD49711.1 calpain large subunit domain III containing protein [Entamoeba histolytica KU27]EMH72901.1 calpain large subunit domain III containing protein [Entamoeba histolytica HM-1:IMSS-B]EMS13945.1 calpain large subunit domain III containing protein [Entamoeba histolytica HM-3:IMSS]ENY65810.1 calpain large subunit domain III containing protein [Entamoeba histolytica HM-1:IMSS-A]GAT98255.1 calpain large su|eukprot:XP_649922.1 calpain large subunit domain III containing protein [Entamoeba histolytica HM-1:IMSS]